MSNLLPLPKSLPPPEVNRILYVKNLPYTMTSSELYTLFGRFGSLRQIRLGSGDRSKGTAFVVYNDIFCAESAFKALNGFNCGGRYLTVNYFRKDREERKNLKEQQEEEIRQLKEKLQAMQDG